MTPDNPTPSAAAMAAIDEIFQHDADGAWRSQIKLALIIDKHYAAQRRAIGAVIKTLERAYDGCHGEPLPAQLTSMRIGFELAVRKLRAVHSGGSTGEAKEGGAS